MIELKDISIVYGKGEAKQQALDHVNLRIPAGAFVTITGKSGCGKTSLLNVLGGIRKPQTGQYLFEGQNVFQFSDRKMAAFRNKNIGFIVQHFALIQDWRVWDNVILPLVYRHKLWERKNYDIMEKLVMLGIKEKRNKYPYQLSGGECQRVAIARAMVADPQVILADEPTGALDEENGKRIMNILKELNREGKTVIMVTHDMELAREGFIQIHMRDGKIIEGCHMNSYSHL